MTTTRVELDPSEWAQVLQILAQAPWHAANPLIMKIGDQLRSQPQEGSRMTAEFADRRDAVKPQ
jgi:hypothetical protein